MACVTCDKLMLVAMHSMAVIRLSLFLSLLQCSVKLSKSEPVRILIIALPQSDHTEVSASWERGEEILPGALAAINETKNNSSNFTVIEVTSGPVTNYGLSYSGNVLEVIASLTWQNRTSDIIGIAGVFHPNILAVLNRFQWPIVSLVSFNKIPLNSIHYTTASVSTLTDSIIAFLKEVHPRKIGIITELKQPYLAVSNEFSTKSNVRQHHEYHGHHSASFSDTIEGIFVSNAHVILLSVSPSAAIPLLCEAYKRGLTWPKYAWILHSYRLDDLLRRSSISNEGCRVQTILEGIFMFQLTKEPEGGSFDSGAIHHKFSGIEDNPYSYLLYESVQALISSVDTRSISDFNKAPSSFRSKSGNSTVYAYHNLDSTTRLIGIYNGKSSTLTNMSETIFTDYDLPIFNKSAILFPYLLPLSILSFIFNTILLILYVIFHNEPSIKSTSVSISMLIFIGCYALIGYSISLIVSELYQFDFCMVFVWLSGTGLSMPLILATILVKMLRVYRIFTAYKILKQSAHLSDVALLAYTILILSPNIILLILWTAIDPQYRVDNFIEHSGYIEKVVTCHSGEYELTWYALAFVYLFLLSDAVVIIAIKSRNIRFARFKDTKTVNIFIFLISIIGKCTFIYWQALSFLESSFIILYVGHMLIAFLCQISLFVPKIWPAVQKKIIHRDRKYRGH